MGKTDLENSGRRKSRDAVTSQIPRKKNLRIPYWENWQAIWLNIDENDGLI